MRPKREMESGGEQPVQARARVLLSPSARSDVPPFMVMDVMEHAARIEAAGGRVIHMEVGQPAANAPATAIRAAKAALETGRIGYTTALGIPSLRNRIAGYYREQHKLDVDPARIVVTTGSSGAFALAFLSLFEPGDRVAMASPGYPPYRNILRALGCVPVEIEISERDRWAITKEALLAEHARAPLAGVIVASPANPTGTMIPPEQLKELIGACADAGIRFISDEIYHGLDYAFFGETAAKFSNDVFVINSFSKYFCMTGWRVGWMVVPEAFIRAIERLQQNFTISVPTLSQIAAEAAFEARDEMDAIKRGYVENRRILIEGLPQAGLDNFLPADGAFYLYANVARFTNNSLDFAKKMLDEAGVAATSGVDFDTARGAHYLRFCYAGSAQEMHEAVERIGAWLRRG